MVDTVLDMTADSPVTALSWTHSIPDSLIDGQLFSPVKVLMHSKQK